ncbi:STN domain-containing protein [Achromobacter ruhlandii]|uniref:STN domain-containing protein n=1 Tax=Achromobacter ruhlandii TaxID=72557 RepID=UPI000C25F503|nr:STN domain-containing protein [Achromobacter ruhlandii]PJM70118.1 TonB-dependent outer membrane receptor [Achromobacter ruhlandii]
MTVTQAPGAAWAFACWFALGLAVLPPAALAQQRAADGASIAFDIAAQPLDAALAAYTQATGMAVLVTSRLTAGRQGSAVRGRLAPRQALRQLLAGTGLQARYASASAFTLVESAASAPPPRAAGAAPSPAAVTRYAGVLQNTVTRALCQGTGAQFGRYRASLQLWIGRNGVVRQARVLSGTGDARRDEALAGVLSGLIMDAPPPADLPQPVTIVLAPRPDPRTDCRLAGAAG